MAEFTARVAITVQTNSPCAVDGELTLSPIANLFWNARERRLRAGWRLLVFLVMLLVVAAVEGRVRAGLAGRLPAEHVQHRHSWDCCGLYFVASAAVNVTAKLANAR